MAKPNASTPTTQYREVIEPVSIGADKTPRAASVYKKYFFRSVLTLTSITLLIFLWFVVSAKTIVVEITPLPDTLQLNDGSIAIKLQDRFLAQPGEYQLVAKKAGYYPLEENISVGMLATYNIKHSLRKKPGLATVHAEAPQHARVYIDRRYVGVTPLHNISLSAGNHTIELQRYRYQPLWSELQIAGAEQKQKFSFRMIPDWSPVTLDSQPRGAQVWVDGELHGLTPLDLELDTGTRHLELVHPDFAAHIADFVVLPNQPLDLGVIELDRAPSNLIIKSIPTNATVYINNLRRGTTPITVTALPNVDYTLRFAKPGYRELSRSARVTPGESKTISVGLNPILATVHLEVSPQSATVAVDGKTVGTGNQTLSLTATDHVIEIKESGYEPYVLNLSPQPGRPIQKNIELQLRKNAVAHLPARVSNSQGHEMQLIQPQTFTMGASRREQGRRANEILRDVKLQRRFYIGTKEVSNEEFARFDPQHNSGSFGSLDLTQPKLPVTNISWEQAARYCNWLSNQEDLPLSYHQVDGKLRGTRRC